MKSKQNISDQLRQALRICTGFHISRYLMANADGRRDGMEKAQAHIELCKIFISVICNYPLDSISVTTPLFESVHSETQKLTGYMDKEIGFPVKGRPDYDDLEPKFFDKFYELAATAIWCHQRKK